MAEKNIFPQIPGTVWWGVRAVLQRSPSATVDERLLSVQLNVQDAAARQYIVELKRVGLLTEEGKATAVAQRWRLDDSYVEAVDELLAGVYPEGLLQVAPPGGADRQKVISWFLREGLGQGAAGNKAATYMLIGAREPNEAGARPNNTRAASAEGGKRPQVARSSSAKPSTRTDAKPGAQEVLPEPNHQNRARQRPDGIPLNVNVQIHIGADAGQDQIESIFAAMRRYLYDDPVV
jgi:hypothetical protein